MDPRRKLLRHIDIQKTGDVWEVLVPHQLTLTLQIQAAFWEEIAVKAPVLILTAGAVTAFIYRPGGVPVSGKMRLLFTRGWDSVMVYPLESISYS